MMKLRLGCSLKPNKGIALGFRGAQTAKPGTVLSALRRKTNKGVAPVGTRLPYITKWEGVVKEYGRNEANIEAYVVPEYLKRLAETTYGMHFGAEESVLVQVR